MTLFDQIRIAVKSPSTMFGTNGDSGSVVVDDDRNVVGLYYAGNSSGTLGVANPIAKVLSELAVKMCTGPKLLKEDIKEFKELKEHKPRVPEDIKWNIKTEKIEKIEKDKIEKEKPEKEKHEKIEFEDWRVKGLTDIPPPFPYGRPPWHRGAPPAAGGTPWAPGRPMAAGDWPDPFQPPMKQFFDKPYLEVYDPKYGLKDKDEFKEHKNEHKESKEVKDGKDDKDNQDKLVTFDIPPVVDPGMFRKQSGASGQGFHFIPQNLRPDLGKGALRNERG